MCRRLAFIYHCQGSENDDLSGEETGYIHSNESDGSSSSDSDSDHGGEDLSKKDPLPSGTERTRAQFLDRAVSHRQNELHNPSAPPSLATRGSNTILSGSETWEQPSPVLQEKYKFSIKDDPEETWTLVWDTVRSALKEAGHSERLTLENVNHVSFDVSSLIGLVFLILVYPLPCTHIHGTVVDNRQYLSRFKIQRSKDFAESVGMYNV